MRKSPWAIGWSLTVLLGHVLGQARPSRHSIAGIIAVRLGFELATPAFDLAGNVSLACHSFPGRRLLQFQRYCNCAMVSIIER